MHVCQAPDGQTFYTYAKAQDYWQSLGQAPLKQPVTDASRLSSRRVARLPVGWEVQVIHHDAGKQQGQVIYCCYDTLGTVHQLHAMMLSM